MDMHFDLLRRDLAEYTETALRLGLPVPVSSREETERCDEAELVSMAADLGWDLGRYLIREPAP